MSHFKRRPVEGEPLSSVSDLGSGKAFALHNVVELDGRMGSFPVSVRGFAPINCYLLKDEGGALLLDTSFGVHEKAIIKQIESINGRDTPLMICPLRVNDFMSVCNSMPIANYFPKTSCLALSKDTALALDFFSGNEEQSKKQIAKLPLTLFSGSEWIQIGKGREVKFYQSPIRLISTRWVYDPLTKTLFTSDMFTHALGQKPDEDWEIDETSDTTTEKDVRAFLLSTRYWWLDGAKNDGPRRGLAKIFESCDIETLAPGYGKLICGRKSVERHYQLLDDVLRKLDVSVTPARYVARNEEHYA